MKKKEKDMIPDEQIIDFDTLEDAEEELEKHKDLDPEEIEKNFIFDVPEGCPICGGDVKGNDHFRFFCPECNMLFEKKDVLSEEFGRKPRRRRVRRTKLTDDERAELEKKRKALTEKMDKAFSEKEEKEEETEEAEEPKEETGPEEVEEVEAEIIPPKGLEAVAEEVEEGPDEEEEPEPEEEEPEESEEPDETEEVEEEPEEETEEKEHREEYELESSDKIIASSQSTKMHAGNCHFVKKIHPKNRIYLNSTEEGEEQEFEMCVCLRRLKAMQR